MNKNIVYSVFSSFTPMKTKKEIVKDWITRYTGVEIESFGEFILLTNFQKYVEEFAKS